MSPFVRFPTRVAFRQGTARSTTLVATFLLLLVALGCGGRAQETHEVWTCPMHPQIVADHPGSCPICGMDLVKREPATTPTPASAAGAAPSAATIRRALATVAVRQERAARTARTVGRVVADERRTVRVESRFGGWIAKLDADFTGRRVAKGERLATIDSPELYGAQSEYLATREAARSFLASNLPEVRRGGDDLVLAARRRLELLGLSDAFLAELERTRVAQREIAVVAPASGVVTEKGVVRGQRIEPGMMLFTLVDLSKVWIEADLYESDAAFARVGQLATIGSTYDPALRLEARASFVYPELDRDARTLRVRFDADNPSEALRPGMFVDVEVELGELEGLAVPDLAVLATGERTLVYVVDASGAPAAREVRVVGREGGRAFLAGDLAEGEKVIVEPAFLLDSESRLREAIAGAAAPAAAPHAEHGSQP
jgi:multidrug efflux pump subunit AcrA (membrane-fusion protein)